MSEGVFGFIFGIIAGILLIGAIQGVNPNSAINIVSKATLECEKSLPRDQKCTIVALPLSKD